MLISCETWVGVIVDVMSRKEEQKRWGEDQTFIPSESLATPLN